MAKSPIDRIVALLASESPERRLAAAIVLGELAPRGAAVISGLARLLVDDGPAIQRHALEALARLGVRAKDLGPVWPLLESRDPDVRQAAVGLLVSVGQDVVPEVRARLGTAEGDGRRALESVLSHLGGGAAFDALLEALASGDDETNRATALELRRHVKGGDAKTRRGYRTKLLKFVERLRKQEGASTSATVAAVKVIGFLEDPKTASVLLSLASDDDRAASIRQEALIALRFTMQSGATAEVVRALVNAARHSDRALAQTALMTLAALELPASLAPALSELALHREIERAQLAIEKLGALGGKRATETLVEILRRGDKRRAELAARALADRKDALEPVVALMAETEEEERTKLLRSLLKPWSARLTKKHLTPLLEAGVARLSTSGQGWEPLLDVVAERSADTVAERLRKEAAKLRKARKLEREVRVLRALIRAGVARPEERYRLGSILLRESALDPMRRVADRALRLLRELAEADFDVVKALRGDRGLDLEHLYYVGFSFLEDDVGGGEELLAEVVKKGGRKKIAKAAKNKLQLAAKE